MRDAAFSIVLSDFMDIELNFFGAELLAVEFMRGAPISPLLTLATLSGVARRRIFLSSYSFLSRAIVSSLPRLGGRLEPRLSLCPIGLAKVILL